jgi:hypothetical protein
LLSLTAAHTGDDNAIIARKACMKAQGAAVAGMPREIPQLCQLAAAFNRHRYLRMLPAQAIATKSSVFVTHKIRSEHELSACRT